MKLQTPEIVLIVCLVAMAIFVLMRAKHYFWSRENENHDSYLVVNEKCTPDGKTELQKCPRLEMWGFKMSCVLILLGVNLLLTVYLLYREILHHSGGGGR